MKRALIKIITLLTLTSCTLETVLPTEVGIVYDNRADRTSDKEILKTGTHYIPIYKDLVKVDILPQQYSDKFNCLTKEGYLVKVAASMVYFAIPSQVDKLIESYGENYFETLIVPEFRATMRNSVIKYESNSLTDNKEIISAQVRANLEKIYNERHVGLTLK